MLVLSRRPGEKILFPSLGVSVEVLRSRGTVVRLGIEAPREIPVNRSEVSDAAVGVEPPLSESERDRRHELRNQLNVLTLKLELLRRQLEVGQADNPDQKLSEALTDLTALEDRIGDTSVSVTDKDGLRILIVEDHAPERELLASCLRLAGMNVATVGDGASALDYLKTHEAPELMLLDLRMPGVDGPTLLDAVRHDNRLHDLRVFAVSGSNRAEFDSSPLAVDGWFSKPVRIDALLQAVKVERNPSGTTA